MKYSEIIETTKWNTGSTSLPILRIYYNSIWMLFLCKKKNKR